MKTTLKPNELNQQMASDLLEVNELILNCINILGDDRSPLEQVILQNLITAAKKLPVNNYTELSKFN